MHLILTYGEKGMRGVQVRGLRIAQSFSPNEVVIVNDGESEWLKGQGYTVFDYPLKQFISLQRIEKDLFERYKPKSVIFSDLPTNHITQASIAIIANNYQVPVIITENYYSKKQFNEYSFKNNIALADLVLLNGLSSFQRF